MKLFFSVQSVKFDVMVLFLQVSFAKMWKYLPAISQETNWKFIRCIKFSILLTERAKKTTLWAYKINPLTTKLAVQANRLTVQRRSSIGHIDFRTKRAQFGKANCEKRGVILGKRFGNARRRVPEILLRNWQLSVRVWNSMNRTVCFVTDMSCARMKTYPGSCIWSVTRPHG